VSYVVDVVIVNSAQVGFALSLHHLVVSLVCLWCVF